MNHTATIYEHRHARTGTDQAPVMRRVLSMVKLRKLYTLTLITSKPTISDDPSVSIKYGFIHTSRRRKSLSILVFAAQQY